MTFREKIDNILRISKKKFSSITELEAAAGLGMNTLRKAYNEDREPSKKVIVKLLEGIGINEEWYDTAKGEVFNEKPTPIYKTGENGENGAGELHVYRTIFEGKTEYVVIPRTVMDKTRLVSHEELERKNSQIDLLIKLLGDELSAAKGTDTKKGKKEPQ